MHMHAKLVRVLSMIHLTMHLSVADADVVAAKENYDAKRK